MAKFYGVVGFAHYHTDETGIVTEQIEEKTYYGDILRISRRLESSGYVNDNINFNNEISILADSYLTDNIAAIRYVHFMGANWKINTVTVNYPRITLSIGGLYNAESRESFESP